MRGAAIAISMLLLACGAAHAQPATGGGYVPEIWMEADADGAPAIRVMEPFDRNTTFAAGQVIGDRNIGRVNLRGNTPTWFVNDSSHRVDHGIVVYNGAPVAVFNYRYTDFKRDDDVFGGGIKFTGSEGQRPGTRQGPLFVRQYFADAMEPIGGGSYPNTSNTDCIGNEDQLRFAYLRYVTCRNFGDTAIDTKSGNWYVANMTVDGAFETFKLWEGARITLVNSIINIHTSPNDPDQPEHAWFYDLRSSVSYYNTLWCVDSANPSPADTAHCRWTPDYTRLGIFRGRASEQQLARRMIRLTANPLPDVHPLFAQQADQIVVEYARNGGAWQVLTLPNTGGNGLPPIGDTRWTLPLNLNDGAYVFRATLLNQGRAIGVSRVMDERGADVSAR